MRRAWRGFTAQGAKRAKKLDIKPLRPLRSLRLFFVPHVMKYLAFLLALTLAACAADPNVVAQAVDATLAARPTATPIVVVVTVMSQAQSIPTVTPVPSANELHSPTPLPPDTPTPAPTATPGLPFNLGASIFADDFTNPGQWNQSDDVAQRTAVEDGQLSIALKLGNRFALTYNNSKPARDFYASVAGQASACAARDRVGLLTRVQDGENYYLFALDCDGHYRVAVVVAGAVTVLQDWTPAEAIRPMAQGNVLGARAQGNTLEFFVNNQSLLTLTDNVFDEGGVGVYAGSDPFSENFSATFDDLQVWALQ
jgi:hypothetical protein